MTGYWNENKKNSFYENKSGKLPFGETECTVLFKCWLKNQYFKAFLKIPGNQ